MANKVTIRAIAYRTPETTVRFERICPWCGATAMAEVPSVISFSCACACGAIALGAPACDFDEVVDAMLNHFRIAEAPADRYQLALPWLAGAGIEHQFAGVGERCPLGDVYWYWFRARLGYS